MFCREHVAQLRPQIGRIEELGGDLTVISTGGPHFVAGFRETTGYQGRVLSDQKGKAYRILGFKRSVWRVFDPRGVADAARALRAGARQGRTQGDNFQYGGVAVIGPSGSLAYHYVSGRPGDLAPVEEILSSLRTAS